MLRSNALPWAFILYCVVFLYFEGQGYWRSRSNKRNFVSTVDGFLIHMLVRHEKSLFLVALHSVENDVEGKSVIPSLPTGHLHVHDNLHMLFACQWLQASLVRRFAWFPSWLLGSNSYGKCKFFKDIYRLCSFLFSRSASTSGATYLITMVSVGL